LPTLSYRLLHVSDPSVIDAPWGPAMPPPIYPKWGGEFCADPYRVLTGQGLQCARQQRSPPCPVRMYAFPNVGRWYDFGFLIGLSFWGSGGSHVVTRYIYVDRRAGRRVTDRIDD